MYTYFQEGFRIDAVEIGLACCLACLELTENRDTTKGLDYVRNILQGYSGKIELKQQKSFHQSYHQAYASNCIIKKAMSKGKAQALSGKLEKILVGHRRTQTKKETANLVREILKIQRQAALGYLSPPPVVPSGVREIARKLTS